MSTVPSEDGFDVFLSWSGERSHRVAELLREWLQSFGNLRTWVSTVDIAAGARWRQELDRALTKAKIGVLCVTPENHSSRWLNFEAGALSRASTARTVPYLIGTSSHRLQGPLAAFQVTQADKKGSLELLKAITKAVRGSEASDREFEEQWPRLESGLRDLPGPTYLDRYESEQEPHLERRGRTRVTGERAYNVLLHMFRRESFEEFLAFDLAFRRWEELLDQRETQVVNYSKQIITHIDALLEERRCQRFRRALFIDPDLVDRERAVRVLEILADREERWRKLHRVEVETRVYLSTRKDTLRPRIAAAHDFAAFRGKEDLAIVETTRTSPADEEAEHPQCDIVTESGEVARLQEIFDEFWERTLSLGEAITELREPDLDPKLADCLRTFLYEKSGNDCAVVIEAAYLDLRDPQSQDRLEHLDDALRLYCRMRRRAKEIANRVLLDAFLNDFTDAELCPVESCGETLDSHQNVERASEVARRLLHQHYRMFDLDSPRLFGMRKTRDRVCKIHPGAAAGRAGRVSARSPRR